MLLTKLIKVGMHGTIIHRTQSVLKCNFQQILGPEDFLSNEIEQKTGVAQGDKF